MIETIISFKGEILAVWGKVSYWSKYQWYRIFTNKSPLTEEEAKQHAYGVLSGDIKNAISFRNLDEKKVFILVYIHEKSEPFFRLVLLKQFGNSYSIDWKKEQVLLITELDVVDLQKKGVHDIIFIEESSGTGAGSKILNIVNSKDKSHIKVTEWYNWMEPRKPSSPEIEIEPDDLDKRLLANIEDYAVTQGMLTGNKVDFSKPENAIQNWHRRNGEITRGLVELDFYPGKPQYRNSITDATSTTKIEWIAYFKGPLIGYLKSENKHFIAYSPASIYSSPSELRATGNKVSFTTNSERKSMTFELKGSDGILS